MNRRGFLLGAVAATAAPALTALPGPARRFLAVDIGVQDLMSVHLARISAGILTVEEVRIIEGLAPIEPFDFSSGILRP